jgi:hypothetical protein
MHIRRIVVIPGLQNFTKGNWGLKQPSDPHLDAREGIGKRGAVVDPFNLCLNTGVGMGM